MDKRQLQRNKRHDRVARWIISVGGVGVIVCVLTMLCLIAWTAVPLFQTAKLTLLTRFPAPLPATAAILAAGCDDYRETAFLLDAAGSVRFVDLKTRQALDQVRLRPEAPDGRLQLVERQSNYSYSLLWDDGLTQLIRIQFASVYTEGRRSISRKVKIAASLPAPRAPAAFSGVAVRVAEDDRVTAVWLLSNGALLAGQVEGGDAAAEAPAAFMISDPRKDRITCFTLNREGSELYAGTDDGRLIRWQFLGAKATLAEQVKVSPERHAITAVGLVFGEISVAVGDDSGQVSTWSPVKLYGEESTRRLVRVHTLSQHRAAISGFTFTLHDKGVLSQGADGAVNLDHMTSERQIFRLESECPLRLAQFSLQGDSLLGVDAERRVALWKVRNPHPEVSWKVLFSKVWYENYDRPEYVWQSSSANDDAEAKFSFIPLIFGSLKGTLYALLFAGPLAFFGALYTSQFTAPAVRGVIKPVVEIMAAIPSVVIGFLAALWLAPRVEHALLPVFLAAFTVPVAIILFLSAWRFMRNRGVCRRVERGYEFIVAVPVLLLALALAWVIAQPLEAAFFQGDFRQWLFHDAGIRFDQRNSLIIGFALGFAVIPIIFTIAEDALSNVPKSLKAASLALGASRWQTVWRVVLPSASPGVFAAFIIGFGRAVGETMIVLMATGNTPVLDWGPFSGMRTLSANIAVEIPEAPAGSTLYRILFLSAVLLFLLTAVLNTSAELIRQRLRKRYQY